MTGPTKPDDKTRRAEQEESGAEHKADRPPTPEEEKAAPAEVGDRAKKAYQEMTEKGAEVEGEGRIP